MSELTQRAKFRLWLLENKVDIRDKIIAESKGFRQAKYFHVDQLFDMLVVMVDLDMIDGLLHQDMIFAGYLPSEILQLLVALWIDSLGGSANE